MRTNVSGAAQVASALEELHGEGRALAVGADVSNAAAVCSAFLETVLTFGGVDIVVSNAGFPPPIRWKKRRWMSGT